MSELINQTTVSNVKGPRGGRRPGAASLPANVDDYAGVTAGTARARFSPLSRMIGDWGLKPFTVQ